MLPADSIDELEGRHIWSAPWAVYSEEAEPRHRDFIEVIVGVGDKLTALGCASYS